MNFIKVKKKQTENDKILIDIQKNPKLKAQCKKGLLNP